MMLTAEASAEPDKRCASARVLMSFSVIDPHRETSTMSRAISVRRSNRRLNR